MGKRSYYSRVGEFRKAMADYRSDIECPTSDMEMLRLLHRIQQRHPAHYTAAADERRGFHRAAREKAERGKVAVVWSGMDCDCVRYSGDAHLVKANWRAIEKHVYDTYKWADGPCGYYITTPSAAAEIERQSRDLALEAFEDGHPHCVYY
jgi:hypothetical protein